MEAPPSPPAVSESYTIEDLINGDDRFQAMSFFTNMNDLMGAVHDHYDMLKRFLQGRLKHDSQSKLQLLQECAVESNMAMESVQHMYATLVTEHPYLESFYHVLAIVFLSPFIADFGKRLSPAARAKDPTLAKRFVGDIVEAAFHNRGAERMDPLIQRFTKTSKLDIDTVKSTAHKIKQACDTEVILTKDENSPANARIKMLMMQMGVSSHTWFKQCHFLGGGRSILNTQNLLQKVFDVSDFKSKVVSNGNFFGPVWNETTNPARHIRGDMDQFLAGEFVPELTELCKRFPMSSIPYRQELVPMLDALRNHLRDKHNRSDAPIPIAVSFGFHAMLTAILALQGDNTIARLSIGARASFQKLIMQPDEQDASLCPTAPSFKTNIGRYKSLLEIAKPIGPAGTKTAEMHAFWNPVMAGSYLLFGTYLCSIGLGAATVDAFGQLRFVLHLYNALRARKLVDELELL
jgi:hypothetical protein